jgi:hypothetical protein
MRRCAEAWLAGIAVVYALDWGAAQAEPAGVDPVGIWSCLIYGHPQLGDERVLLRFEADGRAGLARSGDDGARGRWVPLSAWRAADQELSFEDSRTGRRFHGDLTRATLGGAWRTLSLVGGWWCTRIEAGSGSGGDGGGIDLPAALDRMPPLVSERVAMPAYPRQAIRDAKQGRAVSCFLVNAVGEITDPELIELSDEIFRAPTLAALAGSRYRGWSDPDVVRPGCRTYIYRLDAIR